MMQIVMTKGFGGHFLYGVGENFVHWPGLGKGVVAIEKPLLRYWLKGEIGRIYLPVANPQAVLRTGQGARNCITAAIHAFFRRWGLP